MVMKYVFKKTVGKLRKIEKKKNISLTFAEEN